MSIVSKNFILTNTDAFFEILPAETIFEIFSFLTPLDLCTTAMVSKNFKKISDDNRIWLSFARHLDIKIETTNAHIKEIVRGFLLSSCANLNEMQLSITNFLQKSVETRLCGTFECTFHSHPNFEVKIILLSLKKPQKKKRNSIDERIICLQKFESSAFCKLEITSARDKIYSYIFSLRMPTIQRCHIQNCVIPLLRDWSLAMNTPSKNSRKKFLLF